MFVSYVSYVDNLDADDVPHNVTNTQIMAYPQNEIGVENEEILLCFFRSNVV